MHDFKKLQVYQKALNYSKSVRKIIKQFPREEIFGLTNQFWRAADSIILNIAEGAGNSTKKEFARFLDIAIRSGFECIGCIDIAFHNEYITEIEYNRLITDVREITAMLYGLKKSIFKSKQN
jgi:four helix bundle protein